jgi:hypothetical protein
MEVKSRYVRTNHVRSLSKPGDGISVFVAMPVPTERHHVTTASVKQRSPIDDEGGDK